MAESTSDAGWAGFVLVALALTFLLVGAQVYLLGGLPPWLPGGLAGVGLWALILFGLGLFGRWLSLASNAGPRYASFAGLAIMLGSAIAGVVGLI